LPKKSVFSERARFATVFLKFYTGFRPKNSDGLNLKFWSILDQFLDHLMAETDQNMPKKAEIRKIGGRSENPANPHKT
jgi:hypothetical protein